MATTNPPSVYRVLVQTLVAARLILEWVARVVVVGYFIYLFLFSPEVREAGNIFWPAFWSWFRGLWVFVLIAVGVAIITTIAQAFGPASRLYRVNAFADWLYRGDWPIGSQGSRQTVKLEGLSLGLRVLIILMFSWMAISWLENSNLPRMKYIFGSFDRRLWIMLFIGLMTLAVGRTSTGRAYRGWRVFILSALIAIILHYVFNINILGSGGDYVVTF